MNRPAALVMSGTLIAVLALPYVSRADDDDEDRSSYLDRDIDQDRAKIRDQQRDLRRDYQGLQEETREGDWAAAARVRRDIERDERQLRRDQRDVRRDQRERREREDDDD